MPVTAPVRGRESFTARVTESGVGPFRSAWPVRRIVGA